MKDINEVIRKKEAELQQLQRDVESLRIVVRLLSDDDTCVPGTPRTTGFADTYRSAEGPTSVPAPTDATYANPWDSAVKKFP